jgi:hypothetical protein
MPLTNRFPNTKNSFVTSDILNEDAESPFEALNTVFV